MTGPRNAGDTAGKKGASLDTPLDVSEISEAVCFLFLTFTSSSRWESQRRAQSCAWRDIWREGAFVLASTFGTYMMSDIFCSLLAREPSVRAM